VTPCGVFGWSDEDWETDVEPTAVGGIGKRFATGVWGWSDAGTGVVANSHHGDGLFAWSGDSGVDPDDDYLYAGYFEGNVGILGNFWAGAKNCKIDHPLDPENKYLVHACVESSERLNIYRGSATMNSRGEATVRLPKWTQALNEEFDYQLTPIGGGPAPELHIAEQIKDGRFRIGGGRPGQLVSFRESRRADSNRGPLHYE
jgi:hypothetical protein